MISCILLCAGLSTRFGSPKALADINGTAVIEHLQKVLIRSQVDEIIVVLGAHKEKIEPHLLKHEKVRLVYNKDYNLGQTSSFKTGLSAVSPNSDGIMLLPVDFPAVKSQTINEIISEFELKKPPLLIPVCNGKKGHPPIFSTVLKDRLLALDNAVGLNIFEQQYKSQILFVDVDDEGTIRSFNTPQELEYVKRLILE